MSLRTFARAFHRETGKTPADFIRSARLDAARRLLEDSSLPLKTLAFESGFGNVSGMRRAFLRSMGVRPHDYRMMFQSTLGGAGRGISTRTPSEQTD